MAMGSGALRVGAVVVGFLSFALAQQGRPCLYKPNTTISSPEDFEAFRTCGTLNGSLTILWTDDARVLPSLQLYSLTSITGDVLFTDQRKNPQDPISIEANSLGTVDGSLTFADMPKMSMPSFGSLVSVSAIAFQDVGFNESSTFGAATFESLQLVQTISFNGTNVLDIGGNWTGTSFGLPAESGADTFTFVAAENPNLTSINLPGYALIDGEIHIEGNAEDLAVTLPSITKCTLNLKGVKTFDADNLQQIGSDNSTVSNGNKYTPGGKIARRQDKTTSADTGSSLITDNSFTTLSLPSLTSIVGPFEISDNLALTSISFPLLAYVYGQANIEGENINSITVASALSVPADGQLTIQSDNPQDMCANGPLSGPNINCKGVSPQGQNVGGASGSTTGGSQNSNGTEAGGSDSDGSGSNKGLSIGAKAGIGVGVALGVILLLALAFFLIRRNRSSSSRKTRSMGPDPYGKDLPSTSEATTASPLPQRYSKVPSEMRTEELAPRPVSGISFDDSPAQGRVSNDGYGKSRGRGLSNDAVEMEEQQGERFEMEEQQGMRHEMDARSLPDIDLDDESVERRSLEDIERARNSGPTLQHGPVSPVG